MCCCVCIKRFKPNIIQKVFLPFGLHDKVALAGLGLIYAADLQIADDLAAGRLETVLADWLPVSDGLRLYFPDRSRNQPKLRAFIDVARRVLRERAVALPASGREDRA